MGRKRVGAVAGARWPDGKQTGGGITEGQATRNRGTGAERGKRRSAGALIPRGPRYQPLWMVVSVFRIPGDRDFAARSLKLDRCFDFLLKLIYFTGGFLALNPMPDLAI